MQQSFSSAGPSARPLGLRRSAATVMKQRSHDQSPLVELFANFPRGLALLELKDPNDASTWRLVSINDFASSVVVPSIDTFLSTEKLGLAGATDVASLYREIINDGHTRTIGIVESQSTNGEVQPPSRYRLYKVLAFPAGPRHVGILLEDAQAFVGGRGIRVEAERQLAQTCEFVGAILWRAEPETLRFTYVSRHAHAILGYWLERWTGETNFWNKHLFPDDRERVAAICEKIVRERRRRDFEFRMINVDGHVLWFHAAAELAEKPGGRTELVGVMNDITDLKRAEERIRALTSRLMRLQDDERRHISRELHDSLGQYLTSIKINLELLKREGLSLNDQHRALLAESSETLEKCVQEVRSVSYLLHPPLLDELGLIAALNWFTTGFSERSGIEVNLDLPREFSRLPAEMELAVFRIVQESLTNVQRHAHSDSAWVTLCELNDRTEVRITDSGVGLPAQMIECIRQGKTIDGVGLRGMYERVRELGGQLTIESTGVGTAVSAVFPLQSAEENQADAAGGEERKSRAAGKRLESQELRIEDLASATNGGGQAGTGAGRELLSAGPKRRRAPRRSM